MILFHGTGRNNFDSILTEGVSSPSYWGGTEAMAVEYAKSFPEGGVVLCADIERSDLEINQAIADSLYENGDIDDMPDTADLDYSLKWLEGVVCVGDVIDFEVARQIQPLMAAEDNLRAVVNEGFEP